MVLAVVLIVLSVAVIGAFLEIAALRQYCENLHEDLDGFKKEARYDLKRIKDRIEGPQ